MKEYTITVDVHSTWHGEYPRYRVYVDSDLLTERDFIWNGNDTFVRENLLVELAAGEHSVVIEQIGTAGTIITQNVTVNGVSSNSVFIITE